MTSVTSQAQQYIVNENCGWRDESSDDCRKHLCQVSLNLSSNRREIASCEISANGRPAGLMDDSTTWYFSPNIVGVGVKGVKQHCAVGTCYTLDCLITQCNTFEANVLAQSHYDHRRRRRRQWNTGCIRNTIIIVIIIISSSSSSIIATRNH